VASTSGKARLVRLLVGVVARPDQRSASGMAKAHLLGGRAEALELRRLDLTAHCQVVRRRLQVLAYRQHVDCVGAQISHDGQDLVVVLAQSHHQP
jgi:hypothetical protein